MFMCEMVEDEYYDHMESDELIYTFNTLLVDLSITISLLMRNDFKRI